MQYNGSKRMTYSRIHVQQALSLDFILDVYSKIMRVDDVSEAKAEMSKPLEFPEQGA